MKRTKHLIVAALIAAALTPALNSCKKGEGDPFISLKSRKARVAGEWTFSTLKEETNDSETSSSGQTSTDNMILEVNGSTVRVTMTSNSQFGSSSGSGSGAAVATATFDKDGLYTIKYTLTNVNMNYDGEQINMNMTVESSGTWNFLGGVESDYKKKERIVLNTTKEVVTTSFSAGGMTQTETTTDTYANGESSEVWLLTTLKNKEMVIEATKNGTSSYNYSFNSGSSTQTESGTSTSKGSLTATLVQD